MTTSPLASSRRSWPCCLAASSVALLLLGSSPARAQQQFSSLTQVLDAIQAQDRAIAERQAQATAAVAAARQAKSAFEAADAQLQQSIATEVARTRALRQLEHRLYARAEARDYARRLNNLRANFTLLETTLTDLRGRNEKARLAGLAVDVERVELLERTVADMRALIGLADLVSAARQRTSQPRNAQYEALRDYRRQVSAQKQAEGAARKARLDRLRLFHVMGTRFEPMYLRAVSASVAGGGRRGGSRYRATVTPSPEAARLDTSIAFLLNQLEGVEAAVVASRQAFLDAEKRFLDVSWRWQAAHSLYHDMIYHAYALQAGLELADSAITVFDKGTTPATVFFEAAWRIGEAFLTDARIEEPKVGDALIAYRGDLATRLVEAMHAAEDRVFRSDDEWLEDIRTRFRHQSRVLPDRESIARHISDEQESEFVQGVAETATVEIIRQFAMVGVDLNLGRQALRDFLDGQLFTDGEPLRMLKEARAKAANWVPPSLSRFVRGGDAAGELLQEAKDGWLKGKGKDFLKTAVITAAKAGVTAAHRQDMTEAATEVALLDIEWLLRRHEYIARGRALRAFGTKVVATEAAIGLLIAERGATTASRTLTVDTSQPISPTDEVRLRLEFAGSPDGAVVSVAGREFKSFSALTRPDGSAEFTFPAGTFEPGTHTLTVRAVSRRLRAGSDFDADPTTVAAYDLSGAVPPRFSGLEQGSDQKHRLTVAVPATAAPAETTLGVPVGANLRATLEGKEHTARVAPALVLPGGDRN